MAIAGAIGTFRYRSAPKLWEAVLVFIGVLLSASAVHASESPERRSFFTAEEAAVAGLRAFASGDMRALAGMADSTSLALFEQLRDAALYAPRDTLFGAGNCSGLRGGYGVLTILFLRANYTADELRQMSAAEVAFVALDADWADRLRQDLAEALYPVGSGQPRETTSQLKDWRFGLTIDREHGVACFSTDYDKAAMPAATREGGRWTASLFGFVGMIGFETYDEDWLMRSQEEREVVYLDEIERMNPARKTSPKLLDAMIDDREWKLCPPQSDLTSFRLEVFFANRHRVP